MKKKKINLNIEFIDFQEILEPDFVYIFSKYIKSKYNFFSNTKFYVPTKVRFSESFDKKNYKIRNQKKDAVYKEIKSLIKK